MSQIETRAATIAPATLNRDDGTVDVVLSTGAPVKRAGYIERLAIDPAAVTIASRLPVLDSHRQGSISDVKGRVENVRFEAGQIVATLRISDPAALAAIERGDVTGVSIGYRVTKWQDSTDATGQRARTATAWELVEASLVAIPADPQALIRSTALPQNTVPDAATIETRAAIRAIAATAGLDSAWADSQIDSGADVTAARSAAFEAMAQRSAVQPIRTAAVGASGDDPAVIHARQVEALSARMMGTAPTDAARPFAHMGLRDLAADALTRSGVSVRGLSSDDIFTRAAHTTSDFPLLVSNAMGKVAAAAYKAAESPLKSIARQRTLPNFKTATSIRLGEMGRLQEMTESGEFRSTTRAENGETLHLRTFGQKIAVSRKLLIDDDLHLLGDMTAALGQAAAQTEAEELVAQLTGNPDLSDLTPVFDASRGNYATTGTTLSGAGALTALSAARKAMRTVKGLDSRTIIDAQPRYLVVGPDAETDAEKLLATIYAPTTDDVQPIKLQLVVESRLTGAGWYLLADPARVASLHYAYLAAAPGVQIQRQESWDTLGLSYRVYLDFGCGWLDWRGAYHATGAA